MFDMQGIQNHPSQLIIAKLSGCRSLFLQLLLLCLRLSTPCLAQTSPLATPAYPIYQQLRYEPVLSYFPQLTVQSGKKPSIFPKKEDKKSLPKVHPRKKLLEEAPIHTQRAWLYSAIIPGLGQFYNKNYWEIPVIYGVFGLLAWGAIYNHGEYTTTKRELIDKIKNGSKESDYPNLVNYMDGRKRDRSIFVASMLIWYMLNVFEAYVGGTLKTFDVSDDLEVVIQSQGNSSISQNTSIGLSISLQPKNKDEDRTHWVW